MVDGLNFKDFVAFLSAFSPQATIEQKIECKTQLFLLHILCNFYSLRISFYLLILFSDE